jgi:ATP-binding cassette subfamily C protein CydC
MGRTLAGVVRLARPPAGWLASSVVLGALAVAFGIGLMTTAGYLIARAAERPAILSLTTVIVVVRFFGLARPIARYLERVVSHDLAFRVLARLRLRFYERIEPLAPAELDAYRRGDLVSRMVGDVDALQTLYLRGLGPPLVASLAGAAAVGVAAAILPAAAIVLTAGLLAGGVTAVVVAALLGRASGTRAIAQGKVSAELVELLRGAPELVVYGREEETLRRFREGDGALARLAHRDALAAGTADALMIIATGLTTVAVLAVAVSAHASGELDRTLVAALALLSLSSFEAVALLPPAARELSAVLGSGRRVLDLTDREPTVQDPGDPLPTPRGTPAIALEGVSARYSDVEPPALEHVDLTLEPGRKLALVGPSGVGKTTIVRLLLRFLDPYAGRVTLAGQDLRRFRQEDVRSAIAVAGQDAYLFSTSIRENVRLGRPQASDADVDAALRGAKVGDWVSSLPDGADTLVGEEGTQLSGGQRQRIALARALLSQAPVLVLDEPTAHLDHQTAEALVRDMLEAAEGRSVLLITHRPEGLDLVDEVVVMG